MSAIAQASRAGGDGRIEQLWRARPRNDFVRRSLAGALLLMAVAWLFGGFDWGDLASPKRVHNLERFAGELRPFPLQGEAWDWRVAGEWASAIFRERGASAAAAPLAISILAVLLAGAAGLVLTLFAARNLVEPGSGKGAPREALGPARPLRGGVALAARGALALLRAIPEYLAAFLLLAVLGATPWTAVLALAIHNAGVLGRLGAETVENADRRPSDALRGLGAGRLQVALFAFAPPLFARFLLFLFYRWESCLREATVLGMLGILSLGYWIEDARTRGQMDVMLFFVLLGCALVVVGDALSGLVRGGVRRAD